ncbi:MAG: 50S ribosomal protein L4 [archaeon]
MKADILNLEGKKTKSIELPSQFEEEYRPDLIKRAVLAKQSHDRQPYGASPEAGMRHSTFVSKRRRKYRGCYGKGIARTPRKIMSRSGTQMNWVGARAPNTVGGKRAHPPKAEKDWDLKINATERRKALRSAIAATTDKELVKKRGHISATVPIIIENAFESLKKAKDVTVILKKLGLEKELKRSAKKTIRAGKGKGRGRKYVKKKGPLIVMSKKCDLTKAAKNIPGVDLTEVKCLNTELLAPGTHAGRLTIWTEDAIKKMDKEKLFAK